MPAVLTLRRLFSARVSFRGQCAAAFAASASSLFLALSADTVPSKAPSPERMAMDAFRSQSHLPISTGVFSVGCVDLADRAVFLRLFYPHRHHKSAEEKEEYLKSQFHRWAKWYPEPEYATGYIGFKYSRSLPEWLGGLFRKLSCDPLCPVVENAALVVDKKALPVIVFSHGNGGCRNTYSMLCAEMASKGFVVAAVEHSDGSACAARRLAASGDLLEWTKPRKLMPGEEEEIMRREQVTVRSGECRSAVALLEALNEGDRGRKVVKPFDAGEEFRLEDLVGRLNMENGTVLSGHSFGGGTAVKALLNHQEAFRSAFLFDSWMFPVKWESAELAAMAEKKQLVFLNYERFQWKTNLETMRNFEKRVDLDDGQKDSDDVYRSNVITVKKAIHYSATDLPTVINGSYLKYPLEALSFLSSFWTSNTEDKETLQPEQVLKLSADLFTAWLHSLGFELEDNASVGNYAQCLSKNKAHLIWGTTYKDTEGRT